MTLAARKKRVEELSQQIDLLLKSNRKTVTIRRGFTTTTTNIRNHGFRKQALENAIKARAKHQAIIDKEEGINGNTQE